jgi:hypothetical protein
MAANTTRSSWPGRKSIFSTLVVSMTSHCPPTPQRSGYTGKSDGSFLTALGVAALLRAEISQGLDIWAGFDLGYVPSGVVFLADLSRTAGMAEVTAALHAGVGFAL